MAIRIAFLNTHPIQYFGPLYAYLNQSSDLDVSAIYLSDYSIRNGYQSGFGQTVSWDVNLLNGYDAQFVIGADRRQEPSGFLSMVVPQLARHLMKEKFDALVVHGHTPVAMLIGAAAAKLSGVRIFMRNETHLGLQRSVVKAAIRRYLIGGLYGRFDGVLAIGSANIAFYRAMGVPPKRIHLMPYAVDNTRFSEAAELSGNERAWLRARLGVHDERPIILYAAKFQPRKHPSDLIRAAAQLHREGIALHVVMVGSGEMDAEVRGLARQLGLKNIFFAGFVNQSALPRYYAACDLFVLPSHDEPWGLAVNEAMCAGLPIIASSEIGCVPDLIHEGVNGHTFSVGDIDALAVALRRLATDRNLRRRMGAASRHIIARWSYDECAIGLRKALAHVGLQAGDCEPTHSAIVR